MYRVFNNYYVSKNHRDSNMRQYLYELFVRVLEDIEYTSDDEKVAMYNIVASWTSVNRLKNTRVYGNTNRLDEEEVIHFTYNRNGLASPLLPVRRPVRLFVSYSTSVY